MKLRLLYIFIMGLFKKPSGNSAPAYVAHDGQPTDGNPKANRFTLEKYFFTTRRIAVLMTYPDAINYKGQKILVFENPPMFFAKLAEKDLDPHFLEGRYSPIARFEPTERGWEWACQLVNSEI